MLAAGGRSVSPRYLLLLALLGWMARLGHFPGLRGVWRTAAGLSLLGLKLKLLP